MAHSDPVVDHPVAAWGCSPLLQRTPSERLAPDRWVLNHVGLGLRGPLISVLGDVFAHGHRVMAERFRMIVFLVPIGASALAISSPAPTMNTSIPAQKRQS